MQAPENTVTYIVALGQFIILALVFNKGMPHRSPIWTNVWLVLALLLQVRSCVPVAGRSALLHLLRTAAASQHSTCALEDSGDL